MRCSVPVLARREVRAPRTRAQLPSCPARGSTSPRAPRFALLILLIGSRPPFPIAVALAALVAAPAAAADYAWPVTYIVDSDTVAVDASADMPPALALVIG